MKRKSLGLIILAIALFFAIGRHVVKSQDPLTIPTQKLPSPNGWDSLERALKAVRGEPGGTPSHFEATGNSAQDLILQRAYVEKNGEAFQLLQQAFRYPVVRPFDSQLTGDYFNDAGKNSEYGSTLREFASLIVQKSRVERADKKFHEAAHTSVDVIQLGVINMRQGGLLEYLVGAAVESLGRGELQSFVSSLDADSVQSIVQRLESIETSRPSYSEVLTGEKRKSLFLIQASFQWEHWKKFRASKGYDKELATVYDWSPTEYALMQKTSDRQIQLNYVQEMDRRIKAANGTLNQQPGPEARSSDPLSNLSLGFTGFRSDRYFFLENVAEARLFTTQMALRTYQMQKGQHPQLLQELAPQILKQIPIDPFAPGQPLRYRRVNTGYLLYSIGGDEKDDRGAPLQRVNPNKGNLHQQSLAKGDILAEPLK